MRLIKFQIHKKLIIFIAAIMFAGGCSVFKPSEKQQSPTLLKTEIASKEFMISQINNLAKVNSMYAKIDLKFIDNSFAEVGLEEKFKTVPGLIVVQRPASIQLKVQVPIVNSDIVQMTSDGEKFRVAILNDGGSGKNKNFVMGTNSADYSALQKDISSKLENNGNSKDFKQNVNAFANLRPQHFTEAILVKPTDETANYYLLSTILIQEENLDLPKKSPVRNVLRGYYLLDEISREAGGGSAVKRRFWFDRVGTVRVARQQIFDANGEIESDIVYGQEGELTDTGNFKNLPLRVEVTRPKEKYKMRLTYQSPENVSIGKTYPKEAFVLENSWNLPVIDLDKKLLEISGQNPTGEKPGTESRTQ